MSAFGVDLLVEKLVSLIEAEATFIGQATEELDEIKAELVAMRSFLEDTERIRAPSEGDKAWVAEVRSIASKVEDIIDEYAYHLMSGQRQGGKFTKFLYQTFQFPQNIWEKRQLAAKLNIAKAKIKSINERRQRYDVNARVEEPSSFDVKIWARHRAESSLLFKDDDLVGIEDDKQLLAGWLIQNEPQRIVISVVGMGGSGKTTLVAKVFDGQIVKRHFDCYAWITVSQTYVIEDLIKRMIKAFYDSAKEGIPKDLSTMTLVELQHMLVNFLRPKRYVIVLDDVWTGSLWRDIEVSLPDEGRGSRIMLTTRNEKIASSSFGVKSLVHSLKPLGINEAWSLFCMKAFSSNVCPPELDGLAHILVAKCEGLPLAIVVLGCVMSSKKLESQWRQVVNSLKWELDNNSELGIVKSILLFSFYDLPHRLERCFLYCCLFPEDYIIKRKRLIRLWIAEGFVENVEGLALEEVADGYLMEIVSRSMLQVQLRNPIGRPKECKMHDLMREVAISTSAIENFCTTSFDPHKFTSSPGEDYVAPPRRASIRVSAAAISFKPWKGISNLRSLLVFTTTTLNSSPNVVPNGLRLLRVLDLEDFPITNLPDELVSFYNLRHLNLRGTMVTELPRSIGRLRNLQFLDMAYSGIKELPSGITELQNLRYLSTQSLAGAGSFELYNGVRVPATICKLKNLQALYGIEANRNLLKELKKMTQLRSILITKMREVDGTDLCTAIESMNLLRRIQVQAINEDEYLCMDAISTPLPYLKSLELVGKLRKVPRWINLSLHNLTVLYLSISKLEEDPIPCIQHLPSLADLLLRNAYVGTRLHFQTGFLKLSTLYVVDFPQLTEIIIERGVMPGLESLWLYYLVELKMLPHGIQHLSRLQRLDLDGVPDEVANRIRGNQSVDRVKVKHIPEIKYWSSSTADSYESLSSL